jgi:hypothetical protein
MRFNWDNANINHLGSHGVTSEEFEQAFRNDPDGGELQIGPEFRRFLRF